MAQAAQAAQQEQVEKALMVLIGPEEAVAQRLMAEPQAQAETCMQAASSEITRATLLILLHLVA